MIQQLMPKTRPAFMHTIVLLIQQSWKIKVSFSIAILQDVRMQLAEC